MFAVDKFKFKVIKEESDYGEYEFAPLPRGFGITLANALRRVLLSSIEGAAITSVKVAGVKHEYSTIPGVIDDVLTILLRLKKLAFVSHSKEPRTLELDVKGKKEITAKDIDLPADIEIKNKDHKITELTNSKAKFSMTMEVESGRGYKDSDETKRSQVGVIPLDANFSPVRRVAVDISKTRVGQQVDLDSVTVAIFTNGAMTPGDALKKAVEIYEKMSNRLYLVVKGEADTSLDTKKSAKKKSSKKATKEKSATDLDIDKLNLTARLTNALLKAGYKNLTELEGKAVDEIMEIPGLGQRSAEELIEIMKSYKLEIKE